jgi:peptidoglycan/LPS O-acetylase OafA/YrhL
MPLTQAQPLTLAPVKFEAQLEGLRGFAALVVVLCHGQLLADQLAPGFKLSGIWSFIPPGHFCVLVFFTLSGYVIGLTNRTSLASRQAIGTYVRKRLQRLYPIYFLVVVITFILFEQHLGYLTLARHLTFMQVLTGPVLNANIPLWSLNFEIIYYALFIPVSYFGWPTGRLIGLSVVIGAGAVIGWLPPFLAAYAFGFTFWLTGLYLSRLPVAGPDRQIPGHILAAYLFLLFGYQHLSFTSSTLHRLNFEIPLSRLQNFHQGIIAFPDLGLLVFCIPLLLRFTNRYWRWTKVLEYYALAVPLLHLSSKLLLHALDEATLTMLFFPILSYVLALSFYFLPVLNQLGQRIVNAFIPTGKISYGIYLAHYPVIFGLNRFSFHNDSPFGYAVRFTIFVAVTFGVGYLLEMKFQPFIKRVFFQTPVG